MMIITFLFHFFEIKICTFVASEPLIMTFILVLHFALYKHLN